MTMIWNIRRGLIFRVTVLSFLCWCGAAQRRARFCVSLLNCFDTSLLCPVLFGYYNCTDFNIARNTEPACGVSRVTGRASLYAMPRVVGGVDAVEREFPWTVNVEDEESLIGMCGGSIIRKDVILTAAHCVRSLVRRPKSLRIGYGSTRLSQLVYVRASRISVHPDYNPTNVSRMSASSRSGHVVHNKGKGDTWSGVQITVYKSGDNDIAVVVLHEALPLNNNLRSICLPEAGSSYDSNGRCIIAGWGILNENGNRFPDSLQKAAVPLVPRISCQRAYSNNSYILVSERQVCAGFYGTGGVDACTGDSGGPLICPDGDKWVVYGVVSRGNGCGRALFPGVYAYVPQYIDWITSQMN